jgi:hypothetical protein
MQGTDTDAPRGEDIDRETIALVRKIKTSSLAFQQLFWVNWQMWELEDDITKRKEDLETVGKLYLELRELTKVRAGLKGETKTY